MHELNAGWGFFLQCVPKITQNGSPGGSMFDDMLSFCGKLQLTTLYYSIQFHSNSITNPLQIHTTNAVWIIQINNKSNANPYKSLANPLQIHCTPTTQLQVHSKSIASPTQLQVHCKPIQVHSKPIQVHSKPMQIHCKPTHAHPLHQSMHIVVWSLIARSDTLQRMHLKVESIEISPGSVTCAAPAIVLPARIHFSFAYPSP
jgi:hypothetical protein